MYAIFSPLYKRTTLKLVYLYLLFVFSFDQKRVSNNKTRVTLTVLNVVSFSLLIVPDYEFIPVQFIKEEVTPESRNITLKAFGQEYRLYLTENKNLLSPGKHMPF